MKNKKFSFLLSNASIEKEIFIGKKLLEIARNFVQKYNNYEDASNRRGRPLCLPDK